MTLGTQSAETDAAVRSITSGRTTHWLGVLADYWTLTKPEVNFLIVITTLAGFYLASPPATARFLLLFNTLVGTLLVASGTGTLNQYIERNFDAQMRRTVRRPLPAGRINPSHALWFGILLSFVGGLYLAVLVNLLASLLAMFTLSTYLLFYTPLKRKTPLCTLVGAFPGAMPPLIGWAGACGHLSPEAGVLYAILFFWQFPHFMAIAWMYREDYARAGYLTLPGGKWQGRFMAWQVLVFSLALVPVTMIPTLWRQAGLTYLLGAFVLSSGFVYYAARLAVSRSNTAGRRLLLASIVYLPLVFALMISGKALP
jgi:protoheme IX farnesyltransferase